MAEEQEEAVNRLAALEAENARLWRALGHAMACDYPDEVDFRCDGCNDARAALAAARQEARDA